jgi:hypothetical protein
MTQASNTEAKPIAIIRQTMTVSIAFAEKPSEERRRQLRDSGYRYENGQWYKSQLLSEMAAEELVAKVIAA